MPKSIFVFLIFFNALFCQGQVSGGSVMTDGLLDEDIWKDAEVKAVNVEGMNLEVLYASDVHYLYVAFTGLHKVKGIRLNAEVLIDTSLDAASWSDTSYWFHSSYSNCSAKGTYYYWDNCYPNHSRWQANGFPLEEGKDAIEFKITKRYLELNQNNKDIRMALKLSSPDNRSFYWPETAQIEDPSSWNIINVDR
jgi:hypothetical protein